MEEKNIKQIFIKCHDNDFWNYYTTVLKWVFDYYSDFRFSTISEYNLTEFIYRSLDSLYLLQNGVDKFPWTVKVYFNEEARKQRDCLLPSPARNV